MWQIVGKMFVMTGGKFIAAIVGKVIAGLITQKLVERITIRVFIWLADKLIASSNNKLTTVVFEPVRAALVEMEQKVQ